MYEHPASEKAVIYIFNTDSSFSTEDRIRIAVCAFLSSHPSKARSSSACDDTSLEIRRAALGKPYLPNMSDVYVSASHSGDYLVCAVADTEIGVDIQRHEALKNETEDETEARLRKLAKRFLHPDESEFITDQPWERFFKVWTAKESYVKYTGSGLEDDIKNFSVLPDDTRALADAAVGVSVSWSAADVWFHQIKIERQYTMCVCTKELVSIDICRLQ